MIVLDRLREKTWQFDQIRACLRGGVSVFLSLGNSIRKLHCSTVQPADFCSVASNTGESIQRLAYLTMRSARKHVAPITEKVGQNFGVKKEIKAVALTNFALQGLQITFLRASGWSIGVDVALCSRLLTGGAARLFSVAAKLTTTTLLTRESLSTS